MGIAAVAFVLSRKPDGIGTEWLGPEWLAEAVGFAAFLLLAYWFVGKIKRTD